jgi:hypothetical protein
MTREELTALRDAIALTLALPDSVRALLAQWLMPESAKPNGRDPHPSPTVASDSPAPTPTPPPAKARRRQSAFSTKTAERKLLAAMRDNPGLSVIALANAAGSSRSGTGERLRQLALRGTVEKDLTGRWKLKAEEKEPGPTLPPVALTAAAEPETECNDASPPPAHPPWLRPLSDYERRETAARAKRQPAAISRYSMHPGARAEIVGRN